MNHELKLKYPPWLTKG